MPEGHTLHWIADKHRQWFSGQTLVVESPQGRFADEAKMISGRKLVSVEAYGKHLFYHWSADQSNGVGVFNTMHVHLGLYGKFRTSTLPLPQPRGAVRVRVVGPHHGFDLNGPNCCELIDMNKLDSILRRLGPDPLRQDADPEKFFVRVRRSRSEIGGLLLNQSVIAGIGNIYRAELLFALGIHPTRTGNSLSSNLLESLWRTSVELLRIGKRYNRIITVTRKEVDRPLSRLQQNERLRIYKKTTCPRCGGEIQSWTQSARTIFACPQCQR